MDRHGIERACVLPLVSPESTVYPQTSDDALAAFKAHPDRIIPFCCIDPRTNSGNPKRVRQARPAVDDRRAQAVSRTSGPGGSASTRSACLSTTR